jgi:hypothetical protein
VLLMMEKENICEKVTTWFLPCVWHPASSIFAEWHDELHLQRTETTPAKCQQKRHFVIYFIHNIPLSLMMWAPNTAFIPMNRVRNKVINFVKPMVRDVRWWKFQILVPWYVKCEKMKKKILRPGLEPETTAWKAVVIPFHHRSMHSVSILDIYI